jgi:transposase InsO family protein
VGEALTDLFILHGAPEYIRSDNGPEFIAKKVHDWIAAVGSKTAYIEPSLTKENGYCESFIARFELSKFWLWRVTAPKLQEPRHTGQTPFKPVHGPRAEA